MIDTGSRRHCGQLRELQVASKGNFLRVTFRSNDRLDGTGFRAEYIFLKDSEMQSVKQRTSGKRFKYYLIKVFTFNSSLSKIRNMLVYRNISLYIHFKIVIYKY